MHAPSEHTVDGKSYDLELHIVHSYMDGSFGGVIGVFFDRQAGGSGTNLLLEQIPQGIYSGAVGNSVLSEISLKGWLDTLKTDKHWTYDGSLTTPPCSEGIKWTVLADVQPISQV